MPISAGVLTISDRCSRGESQDAGGPLIVQMLTESLGADVRRTGCVPDDRHKIAETLSSWCDRDRIDLIVTTGGTGFSTRDVTPEATRDVIERDAPGLAEAMRSDGLKVTPHAMLSRAVCGIRGQTLIINLPGNPKAIREGLQTILPVLPHGVDILKGTQGANEQHEFGHRGQRGTRGTHVAG